MSKLLILSDIHGNWPALRVVIEAEGGFDAAVFCGDVVDYGPQPAECLHWIRHHCSHMVRGNHDNALAFDTDCHCMGSFRNLSLATRAWHSGLLAEEDKKFLGELPVLDWFEWEGRHFRMAHATPQGDLFEYLAPEQWEQRVHDLDADFVILGHTHVQGTRTFGGLTVVNPGSVGLARDHASQACYATYEDGTLTLKRIPYAVEETVAALKRAPLPAAVIEGLIAVLTPKFTHARPIASTEN